MPTDAQQPRNIGHVFPRPLFHRPTGGVPSTICGQSQLIPREIGPLCVPILGGPWCGAPMQPSP
eukprot:12463832-Heterocapsa_arctica.AAC.1